MFQHRNTNNRFSTKSKFVGNKKLSNNNGERSPVHTRNDRFSNKFKSSKRFGSRRNTNEEINTSRYVNKIDVNLKQNADSESNINRSISEVKEIDSKLLQNLSNLGYTHLTPIQDQSFDIILARHDLLGLAGTGTGKTGAFLIPIIQNLISNKSKKILILAPTRELAGQINDVFFQLAKDLRLFSVLCIGGNDMYRQINGIRRGFNLIIGTPGRVIDLNERKILDFKIFDTVVLDEVDTMLDMGFMDDVKFIVNSLQKDRQSLFFSATINSKAEEIINSFLSGNYKKISVKNNVSKDQIHQDIIHYHNFEAKKDALSKTLSEHKGQKIIIFANTKREVDQLEQFIIDLGYRVSTLHGDKRQNQRKRMLDAFKKGETSILLATNVASRGIDIKNVDLVVNYDEPESYDDYIHRIGRTGRADSTGKALTFVKANNVNKFTTSSGRDNYSKDNFHPRNNYRKGLKKRY